VNGGPERISPLWESSAATIPVAADDHYLSAALVGVCMPEEVLFKSEANHSRSEVAAYLRQVADSIDGGGPITLKSGGESVTMDPPGSVEFEVKAEREGPANASGELSVEFELEWDENASGDESGGGSLEIE